MSVDENRPSHSVISDKLLTRSRAEVCRVAAGSDSGVKYSRQVRVLMDERSDSIPHSLHQLTTQYVCTGRFDAIAKYCSVFFAVI